jgi:hypothetical protein
VIGRRWPRFPAPDFHRDDCPSYFPGSDLARHVGALSSRGDGLAAFHKPLARVGPADDRIPKRGEVLVGHDNDVRVELDRSACRDRQSDDGIIADRGAAFQRDVAGALDGPFIVLFEQDGPDEPGNCSFMGEIPTTSVRRLISPFNRSSGLVLCSLVRC